MPKRKEPPSAAEAEAPRRTGRVRRTVTELRLREAEAAADTHTSKPKARAAYKPPEGEPARTFESSLDWAEGKRDKRNRLVFDDAPDFKPILTPRQVIRAGSFGGIYFNPNGGRPGIRNPGKVDIDHKEFPAEWFEGLPADFYRARRYDTNTNKYRVKAGQNQKFWEEKGWIIPQDPRGWFHWYCRFYLGRRTEDDERQIKRWKGVCGEKGRWKRSLVTKVLAANKRWDDGSVSPVLRQTLLHWAYELTEPDFEAMRRAQHAERPLYSSRLTAVAAPDAPARSRGSAPAEEPFLEEYDAIVVGGGMGGLTAATQLAASGASVLVLERYLIPGGSAGQFQRQGHTFDVGSSMMFGMGPLELKGTTNLITRALAAVGKSIESIPDPTQIHYHLPKSAAHPEGLEVKVWRVFSEFTDELVSKFPHEERGVRRFYADCWAVFDSLNALELKSLEEPLYLLGEFRKQPGACLTLTTFLGVNAGERARKYMKDPELLNFIDIECYCWSTVLAAKTPMINAGMVFGDRHFGGINYPRGGVGRLAELLVEGLEERGGRIVYKANVREILTEGEGAGVRAVGVKLADGRVFRGRTVVSNATRWDTFEGLMASQQLPPSEQLFRKRYKKSPSFLSIHMSVRAEGIPQGSECHHIVVEDWEQMQAPYGTLFVSIPTLLDPSVAPEGRHIVHAFSPDWIDDWKALGPIEYEAKKEEVADAIVGRLEAILPGLGAATVFREVGTPRTHRRFLGREDGSYGPIPRRHPFGMLGMPFNRTGVKGLYCVGDSTFPGQGVNAVVFSGIGCAHRLLCDLGRRPSNALLDAGYSALLNGVKEGILPGWEERVSAREERELGQEHLHH